MSRIGYAYVRVSTHDQEELSPDSQIRLLKEYAKKNDIILTSIFRDDGRSGRKAEKRPEFMRMIAAAKEPENHVDVILVWKFSRFARNQEESIVYKSLLKKQHNVDVLSISEPLIDGPFGSLIERIIEWMDEYYSIRLSGDVMRGMTEKADRGGYQAKPPLGYSMKKGDPRPEIIPEEAAIVQKIYEDYRSGKGSYVIACELNDLGLRSKRGNLFQSRNINYILSNPFYCGKVRWNYFDHDANSKKEEDDWIIKDGIHNPIIDDDLFQEVQDIMRRKPKQKKHKPAGTYSHWLSGGILRCYKCGAPMSYVNRGGWEAMRCSNYAHNRCDNSHSVPIKKLVPAVLSSIQEVTQGGDLLFQVIHTDHNHIDNKRSVLETALSKTYDKDKRIKEAYAAGIDTLEEYKENKERIQKEREDIQQQLSSLHTEQKDTIDEEVMREEVKSVYDLLTTSEDTAKKNEAIRMIVDRMVVDQAKNEISIVYCYRS